MSLVKAQTPTQNPEIPQQNYIICFERFTRTFRTLSCDVNQGTSRTQKNLFRQFSCFGCILGVAFPPLLWTTVQCRSACCAPALPLHVQYYCNEKVAHILILREHKGGGHTCMPRPTVRTKNSTAPESVVFCHRRSFFAICTPFSCLFFLEKQALLSTLRSVLLLP